MITAKLKQNATCEFEGQVSESETQDIILKIGVSSTLEGGFAYSIAKSIWNTVSNTLMVVEHSEPLKLPPRISISMEKNAGFVVIP